MIGTAKSGAQAALVAAALVLASCGGHSVDVAEMEEDIRSAYQEQLRDEAADRDVSPDLDVVSVECVRKGDSEARCFAEVDGSLRGRTGIDVTIDKDGEYIWEAEGDGIEIAADESSEAPLDPVAGTDSGLDAATDCVASDGVLAVRAGDGTSCEFAERVAEEVLAEAAGGDDAVSVTASSPVTGQSYDMDCSRAEGGAIYVCSGGRDAYVEVELP